MASSDLQFVYPYKLNDDVTVTLFNAVGLVEAFVRCCAGVSDNKLSLSDLSRGSSGPPAFTAEYYTPEQAIMVDMSNTSTASTLPAAAGTGGGPGGVFKGLSLMTHHVPGGGAMSRVHGVRYPTGKAGFAELTRLHTIDPFWKGRTLLKDCLLRPSAAGSKEHAAMLRNFTYLELDIMRAMYVAAVDLCERGGIFGPSTSTELVAIAGLAKRDGRKNCGAAIKGELSDDSNAAAGGKGKQAAAAAAAGIAASAPAVAKFKTSQMAERAGEQTNLRNVLLNDAQTNNPHVPLAKAVLFKFENDPTKPRHQPMFRCTVELTTIKRSFGPSEWFPKKWQAENAAAKIALAYINAKGWKK